MIRRLCLFSLGITLVVGGCAAPADRSPTGGEAYHGLIQYRAKDSKKAIMEPTMVAADQVRLAAGTKVIGVFINGEARAYPLFVLNNHQIVNDFVGGTPISASW